jgi:ring-1,2-phenylacetyl-CoA epoxidase subunit PaaA
LGAHAAVPTTEAFPMEIIREPRVTLIARQEFVSPPHIRWESDSAVAGEAVAEFAGRLCYLSFGEDAGLEGGHRSIPGRTTNEAYLRNILQVKHGSVLEHAVWTLLLEGVSRSLTHELVRHRAGMGYSQLSQRYVDESEIAFVLPPEIEDGSDEFRLWEQSCEQALETYRSLLGTLAERVGDSGTEDELKEKVQNGYILESPDEMTEGYRKALIVQLLVQADTELISAPAYFGAAQDAPSTNTMVSATAIIQDELAHANIAYRLLEDLGLDKEQLVYGREPHEFKHPYGFDQPLESWAELVTANGFFDRAGITLLGDVFEHQYGPLKRALVKVDQEETFHLRHGEMWMKRLAGAGRRGEGEGAARGGLDVPHGHRVVRPAGRHEAALRPAGVPLKGMTNDQLRQTWMKSTVPLCESLGVDVPAHYDEAKQSTCSTTRSPASTTPQAKRWLFDEGEIGWDAGRGPSNRASSIQDAGRAAARVAERVDGAAALAEAPRAALRDLLLVLADSKRVLGLRYSDRMLGAPTLEAGIAASSMAQDEWGHARLTYAMLGDFGDDPKALEHDRAAGEYRSHPALDRGFRTWSDMIATSLVVDTALAVQYAALLEGRYGPAQNRVQKMLDEERFHFRYAAGWIRQIAAVAELRGEPAGSAPATDRRPASTRKGWCARVRTRCAPACSAASAPCWPRPAWPTSWRSPARATSGAAATRSPGTAGTPRRAAAAAGSTRRPPPARAAT